MSRFPSGSGARSPTSIKFIWVNELLVHELEGVAEPKGLHQCRQEVKTEKGGGNRTDNDVPVIDSRKDKVVHTISTQPWPEASVGYEPNTVTLTDDGRPLMTLGRANAVAVYRNKSPQVPASYVGPLSTDYFPPEITTVGKNVVVANTRGIGARRPFTSGGHGTTAPRRA